MPILQTTDLKKYYGEKPNITKALDGVSLSVEHGEFVAIVGTSGSGKSTLLNMIGGLDVPTSGKVIVDGKDLSTLKDEQLTIFRRRKIGFIFQNYNLVPVLNVYENIVLPVELDGDQVDKNYMQEVVRMLGLEDRLNNMPNNLSGGQQQRVAFARAIVIQSGCILFDEPLSALDALLREEMRHELKDLVTQLNLTAVFVTHDQTEAMSMSDKIAVLNGGVVEQYDTPEQIYHHPATAFVARFVGKSNWISDTQLFRPEAMSLEPREGDQRYNLPVQGVQYLGDTYEITLAAPHGNWMFHCDRKAIPGETLSVYIDPNQIISVKRENPTT